jgi:hypothetical protein
MQPRLGGHAGAAAAQPHLPREVSEKDAYDPFASEFSRAMAELGLWFGTQAILTAHCLLGTGTG